MKLTVAFRHFATTPENANLTNMRQDAIWPTSRPHQIRPDQTETRSDQANQTNWQSI